MHIYPTKAIEPTKIVAGCIYIYENIWHKYQDTIDMIEASISDPNNLLKWEDATEIDSFGNTHSGKNRRTNSTLSLTQSAYQNDNLRGFNNLLSDVIMQAVVSYTRDLNIREPIYFSEGINLLKYQLGQEYKAHYDGGTLSGRSISPILYLNDSYEGGEIEFVHHNFKYKPTAGTLVLFPASFPYAHIAHPVTNGTKYAAVTWLHDRP